MLRKDKTLVEILDRLTSLEGKVDRIPKRPSPPTPFSTKDISSSSQQSSHDLRQSTASSIAPSLTTDMTTPSEQQNRPYRHASAAHKMLTWPAIQEMLLHTLPSNMADLRSLQDEGSAFIVRMQKGMPNLPLDTTLAERPFVGMQSQATRNAGGIRGVYPGLTKEVMTSLAETYFDTFNLLYPFMDRQNFLTETLVKVNSEGFNGDADSVIALLIFALGELAMEATRGNPIGDFKGRPSGFRGGTMDRPPGLTLFNEARKRMGFVLTECDLENVQIFSLAAYVPSLPTSENFDPPFCLNHVLRFFSSTDCFMDPVLVTW